MCTYHTTILPGSDAKRIIREAMSEIEMHTSVRFVPQSVHNPVDAFLLFAYQETE